VRILVVDDHPNTADTFARVMGRLGPGVEILSAESGELALEMVKDKAVDLLITDMVMPGMTGLELIKRMQSHPAGRPAYTALMTAYDVPGLNETARRLKVNDVIHKPIHPERLCQIIAKAIEDLGHAPLPLAPVNKPQLKILVADDVADNVALLSRYLENEGYTCLSASNGAEALAKIRAELPDLVLLDVSMPVKDGFEALQEIRADPAISYIPVIILTAARIEPMDMQYALSIGADDYVTKPFDRRELLARIRTRLRVKEAEDIIRQRNKELNLLPEIGRELSARLDVDELLDLVLHRTVEALGAFGGHVMLLTPGGPLHRSYFFPSPAVAASTAHLPPLVGLLDQVGETCQGFIINDTRKDLRWQAQDGDATRAVVVVPMFGRHNILGLLALVHEQAGYFNLEHKLLLQAIASQAAIAVENAQLYAGAEKVQQHMMAVLQNVEEAILLVDAGNRLSHLNPAAERLIGNDHVQVGQPLVKGQGYDALIELLDKSRSAGMPVSGETAWADRRAFTVLVAPVEDGGNLVLLHEISHSNPSDPTRNSFIATATHELKHPLTFINLTSQMLSKVGPLNEKQMEIVDRISNTVKNMDGLLQNMLELALLDNTDSEPRFEAVDINALVADVADEFLLQAAARQQIFQFEKTVCAPIVLGDPFQLRHALRNLADNAIEYSPPGGATCLSVEAGGQEVIIRIMDSGYGIPTEDLPFVFDRFYRGHSKEIEQIQGSGLGLTIVKSIVEQHGGRVEVESEYGKGSCFTVSLPLMEAGSAGEKLIRVEK
jgi:signal transduction histidine kinase/DNA-binding response OmpR family regulator